MTAPAGNPCSDAAGAVHALLERLAPLERDLVSPGQDAALDVLADWLALPCERHRWPSGTRVDTWTVPPSWRCRAAYIATADGERVVDAAAHPLHVARYSTAVDATVSRDELLAHVAVHPVLPDAIPYRFFFHRRDWGFGLTVAQRDALTAPRYRVVIDPVEEPGALQVLEVVLPGARAESLVLCSHVDHPCQVNDDLSGVAACALAVRTLAARPEPPEHTIRALFVAETIGSVAWLDRHAALIPTLVGGLFVEMVGRAAPFCVQRSFAGDTPADLAAQALWAPLPGVRFFPFRSVIGNDERQFNGPRVRVPMLALTRLAGPVLRDVGDVGALPWPYPEYHSSADDLAHCDLAAVVGAGEAVVAWVDAMGADTRWRPRYRGEVCLSAFGLVETLGADWYRDPRRYRVAFDTMDRLDGTRTVAGIACEIGASFSEVAAVVAALRAHGLVAAESDAVADAR